MLHVRYGDGENTAQSCALSSYTLPPPSPPSGCFSEEGLTQLRGVPGTQLARSIFLSMYTHFQTYIHKREPFVFATKMSLSKIFSVIVMVIIVTCQLPYQMKSISIFHHPDNRNIAQQCATSSPPPGPPSQCPSSSEHVQNASKVPP